MASDLLNALLDLGSLLRNKSLTSQQLIADSEGILRRHLPSMKMVLEKGPSHVVPEESGSQIYPINDRYRLRVDQISEITDEQLVAFWRDVAERLSLALGEREEGPLGPFESPAGLQLKSQALESMFNGFDIVDEEGRLVYANRAYLKMWGYESLDEVLGTSPALHCADPAMPLEIITGLKRQGHGNFEFEGLRKDGSTFDVHMYCQLFKDGQGRELYTGVSLDVTEQNQLRKEYLQAQKMEAVGHLTGGIAHDFNNLLSVIIGGLEFTLEDLDPDSPFHHDLENAMTAALKAGALVKQLLVFSRRESHDPEVVDLNLVIPQLIIMLDRLLGKGIVVRYESGDNLSPLMVDHSMLEQVLVNLAVNARDALQPSGGNLYITAEDVELDPESDQTLSHQGELLPNSGERHRLWYGPNRCR